MFGADLKIGDQRVVLTAPVSGKSRHGKTVKLENSRFELADSADSDKLTIAPHEDGDPAKFVCTVPDGYALPDGTDTQPVNLKFTADGRPGSDVMELTDDGIISLKSPDAATLDAVDAVAEDIA